MQLIRTVVVVALAAALCGCHAWPPAPGMPLGGPPALENPLFVPAGDRELLWSQLVDTVDDYFKIQREERVRQIGEVLVEGRIDTLPVDGATLLEPWRKDSTPGFERLHSTLQSVRRRAVVRVMPADNGYLIDVAVYKELEDLARPEHGQLGQTELWRENAVDEPVQRSAPDRLSLDWIPLGRDVSLEQQLLGQLRARLTP